jgi:hypothetical protein
MRRLALFIAAITALPLNATPYDGTFIPLQYYQEYPGMPSCEDVGAPDGITWTKGDTLRMVEMPCALANPEPVRGLDATLYDAQCSYPDGVTQTSGRVMIMQAPGELWVVWDGYIEHWRHCGL